jgi:hypothetical protein
MNLAPGLSRDTLLQTTRPIAHYMFYRARDLIDHPGQRAAIAEQMIGFIRTQFFGALALQQDPRRSDRQPRPA